MGQPRLFNTPTSACPLAWHLARAGGACFVIGIRARPSADVDGHGRRVSQWICWLVMRTRGEFVPPRKKTLARSVSNVYLATMPAMPTQPVGSIRIPSPLYRMTLEKYESLIASGFFTKRDRVRLINGYLVTKMAESPTQSAISEIIRLSLQALLLATWHLRGDKPLRIPAQSSMPEPDLVIVRGAARHVTGLPCRYPEPADTALVVEVPLSSLEEDRAKAEIYGRAGILIYWIVNRVNNQAEVYTNPNPSGYQSHEVLAPGHVLSGVIDSIEIGEIPVVDILP